MRLPCKKAGSVKKAAKSESKKKSGESDSRSIRLVSRVLGDADLQFFCSRNNREGERERQRQREKQSTFRGSGAETNTEAQGVNIQHLQWDLAATVVHFFQEEMGSLICIMQHPQCHNASPATKYKEEREKYQLYPQ